MMYTNRNMMFMRVALVLLTVCLVGQVAVHATSQCQVPNPNEVFCIEPIETYVCSSSTFERLCTGLFDAVERNLFPDGGAASTSGTTTQEQADCHRVRKCKWDGKKQECVTGGDWSEYSKADKTVTGTNACPTEE